MHYKKKNSRNPFYIPAIRNKILVILGIMVIIRILNQIPTPGVNTDYLKNFFESQANAMGFLNMMTGGSLSSLSILALNITPYITASIVLELLTILIKPLEEMKRDGKTGQEKYKKVTLLTAVGLSAMQSIAMAVGFGKKGLLVNYTWYWVLIVAVIWTVCAGALSFVGNWMTDKKYGNGVSLILLCNILSSVVSDIYNVVEAIRVSHTLAVSIMYGCVAVAVFAGMTLFVIYMQTGKRELPVTNSKKAARGSSSIPMNTSTIPIPVNASSVIPVIFASSLFSFPSMIGMFLNTYDGIFGKIIRCTSTSNWFVPGRMKYTVGWLLYVVLILFFAEFYVEISFNPIEIADNLKKQGSQIIGVRPGQDTVKYLEKRIRYTTLLGGLGMIVVVTVPMILSGMFGIGNISLMGTSLVIIVGVLIETKDRFEADMKPYQVKKYF